MSVNKFTSTQCKAKSMTETILLAEFAQLLTVFSSSLDLVSPSINQLQLVFALNKYNHAYSKRQNKLISQTWFACLTLSNIFHLRDFQRIYQFGSYEAPSPPNLKHTLDV